MNARNKPPEPQPEPKRQQDEFSIARSLVKRIRKGDAKIAAAEAAWQAERQRLIAEAPPVARAAAEAMLRLPSTADAVMDPQDEEQCDDLQ